MVSRGTNPEDEYFARREGEMERERDRREAAHDEREEREEREAIPPQRPDSTPPAGRASKIFAALSNAMKALFRGAPSAGV